LNIENRIKMIMSAPSDTLQKVDRVLEGRNDTLATVDTRLLTFSAAAKQLGVSRQTLWRMVNEQKIKVIEIRKGSRRVPASALIDFVKEGMGA